MPIYDLSYRHWEGKLASHALRFWIVARSELRLLVKRPLFIILFLASLLPFVIHTIIIVATSAVLKDVFSGVPSISIGEKFFRDFLNYQMYFSEVFVLIFGSGLIAKDNRTKAMQFYFSKPITKADYFLGKLGGIGILLLLVTAVPAFLLFLIKLAFTPTLDFVKQYYWIPLSMAAFSLFMTLLLSFLVLLFSSISSNTLFSAIKFSSFFVLLPVAVLIIGKSLKSDALGFLDPQKTLKQMGNVLFGLAPAISSHWLYSLVYFLFLVALSAFVVTRKIRGVEVVK
jgi:ABC-type transport system involved in multi-copper enzyme maturation permease subunit